MEAAKNNQYKDIILSIDEENNKCVDCGKENPTKVSVNNGVILCEECATEHSQLGTKISFIRDLSDNFDEYLLNYFTLGGNSKFKRFLQEENVNTSLPINQKYLTKACDYYRINLKKKVQGEKLLEKNYENPNEIVENPENYFPEFENYELKNVPTKGNQTAMGQAKKVLGNIGSGLFSFGKKMYSGAKTGANYIAEKSKPAMNQIKKGGVYVGHQVGGAYSNLKNKIVHKNKPKEEGEKKEGENSENNNQQEQPKEEDKKENEQGPGELSNQPLGNIPAQEENVQK